MAHDLLAQLDETTLLYLDDRGLFAREQLKIRAKNGSIVPLRYNSAQLHVARVLDAQSDAWGRCRALVLKGRQQGISTYIDSRHYTRTTFEPGLRAYILTHEQAATDTIYEMAKRFQQHVDPEFRNSARSTNAKTLRFANGSGFEVATAGTRGVGRSKAISLFHGSEVAFWPNAKDHAAGILQALPAEAGTEGILESTANGVGGYFHGKWVSAWETLQDDYAGDVLAMARDYRGYTPIFIPWFWQAEYVDEPPHGFSRTPEEDDLAARYGLTDEQLTWRRAKISDLDGSTDLFRQEYPCTPTEAFLFSGRSFFGADTMALARAHVRPPEVRGRLEQVGDQVRFLPGDRGWLRVWALPDPEEHYVMGLDVAEGLDDPADRTVGDVLRRGLRAEQVAQMIPKVEADDAGRFAVLVCRYYGGRVPLAIERNSLGLATVIAARDTGYPHLYRMHQEDASEGGGRSTRKLGWQTTSASRPVMLSDLLAGVRDGGLVIHSEPTASEMGSFVVSNSKPQAAQGCRDDCVLSLGIAFQLVTRTLPLEDGTNDDVYRAARRPFGGGAWMA